MRYLEHAPVGLIVLGATGCGGRAQESTSLDGGPVITASDRTYDGAEAAIARVSALRARFLLKAPQLPLHPLAPTTHPPASVIGPGLVERLERLDADHVRPVVSQLAKQGVSKGASVSLPGSSGLFRV